MTEAQFNELAPDGGPLHFRGSGFAMDPLTGLPTTQTARERIAALAVTYGWPLRGLFVSQAGGVAGHFVLHRQLFPPQTGNATQRASKLNDALTAALARVFHVSTQVTDPTDPEFGQVDEFDPFFANVHVWNYKSDNSYVPREDGVGDYTLRIEDRTVGNAPANWWQGL